MTKYILLTLLIFLSNHTYGESFERIKPETSCTFFGEIAASEDIIAYSSTAEALRVINDIVNATGLSKNFEVRSGNVSNAAALIRGTKRYIIYNQNFMQSVRNLTNSRWGATSILAHEIGHHLNAHTLSGGSRPDRELEADYFSGFILQKMGASLNDAQAAMNKIGSDYGSTTHPAKSQRLSSIAAGWSKSCDKDTDCSVFGDYPNIPKTLTDKKISRSNEAITIKKYIQKYISINYEVLEINHDQQFARKFVNIENRGSKRIKLKFHLDVYSGSCRTAPVNMKSFSKHITTINASPSSNIRESIIVKGDFLDFPNSCGGFDVVKAVGFF